MQKNVASQKIGCQMVSATDGSAFTGAVTVYVTGDAGTQAVGSVGSGACTHEGNGYHTYAPAQAETNYDLVAFTFIGTGAVPSTVQVFTRHDANVTHWIGTAPLALSSQQVQAVVPSTQKVDVETIKTRALTAAAGITFGVYVGGTGASALEATAQSILTDTAEIGPAGAGLTVLATAANLATVAGYLDTEIAAILADTNELQTDWANGGRLDLIIDAILDDTGTAGVVVAGGSKTGYTLTATTGLGNQTANITGTISTVTTLTNLPAITANWLTAAGMDANAGAEIATAVRTELTTELARIDVASSTLATAANLATVAGYLDTEVAAILAAVDTEVAAIKSKTDNLPAAPAATGDIPTVAQIWTTALTEAYRATGATGTAAQLLYEILGNIINHRTTALVKTVEKLDKTTTAKTYTYDADPPTAIEETT